MNFLSEENSTLAEQIDIDAREGDWNSIETRLPKLKSAFRNFLMLAEESKSEKS